MSGILKHKAAARIIFENGQEGVLLLSNMGHYGALVSEANSVFGRPNGPDYLVWQVHEPIVLDPPKPLLQDLVARGASDQIYDADLAYLADYELHWCKVMALYVGRWDGAIIRGVLDGLEFVSDPLVCVKGAQMVS